MDGWTTAAYDDRSGSSAVVVPLEGTTFIGAGRRIASGAPGTPFSYDKLSLVGQIGDNAGVFRTLHREERQGSAARRLRLRHGAEPGRRAEDHASPNGRAGGRITLRYSEMLYPDLPESGKNVGMIMTENYRAALSQDVYTMKAGPQVFQPRFTSHGYQYIEITGIDKPLPLAAVQGVAISSVRELTADYKTSSEKVNRLWSNLVWSNVDNFLTIPTDCPQRNERMGWSGDINVFSRTATYVSNADQFLTRHMYAMRDVQAPPGGSPTSRRSAAASAASSGAARASWFRGRPTCSTKTSRLLERHYPAMAAYVDYLETTIDPKTGLSSDAQLGDWLGPQNNALGSRLPRDRLSRLRPRHHGEGRRGPRQARRCGEVPGAVREAEGVLQRHLRECREEDARPTGGGGLRRAAPAAPAASSAWPTRRRPTRCGLAMGLFNDENVPAHGQEPGGHRVSARTRTTTASTRPKYSLMTGFIGTAWISKALSDNGPSELAYRLLHNNQYPSWLYAIDQGATSIWERLNGYTVENGFGGNNSMNSFNHYSFGAVGQWMMAYSLGIQRDEPGFKKFILQPEPDPTGVMTSARATTIRCTAGSAAPGR